MQGKSWPYLVDRKAEIRPMLTKAVEAEEGAVDQGSVDLQCWDEGRTAMVSGERTSKAKQLWARESGVGPAEAAEATKAGGRRLSSYGFRTR